MSLVARLEAREELFGFQVPGLASDKAIRKVVDCIIVPPVIAQDRSLHFIHPNRGYKVRGIENSAGRFSIL